jgi:hypothetical protein
MNTHLKTERDNERTLAPAADAFSTSFMHCCRLSVRLDVEHICPMACSKIETIS